MWKNSPGRLTSLRFEFTTLLSEGSVEQVKAKSTPSAASSSSTLLVMRVLQAARPHPHAPQEVFGMGGGGLDGPHGPNAQVTIRLLVPLAAGDAYLSISSPHSSWLGCYYDC